MVNLGLRRLAVPVVRPSEVKRSRMVYPLRALLCAAALACAAAEFARSSHFLNTVLGSRHTAQVPHPRTPQRTECSRLWLTRSCVRCGALCAACV